MVWLNWTNAFYILDRFDHIFCIRFVFNQIVLRQRIFFISYHSRLFSAESSIAEDYIEESCPLVLCISHKESSIYTERACKLHDMKMTQHGHGLLHKGFNISLLHTIYVQVIWYQIEQPNLAYTDVKLKF